MSVVDWLKAARAAVDKRQAACPACGVPQIEYQYVADEKSRVGYVDIWCTKCGHGIHVSRVNVPAGATLISLHASDDCIRASIPEYIPVTIDAHM